MAWSISEVDIYNDEYQLCCTRRSHHISYSERADAHHWRPFPASKTVRHVAHHLPPSCLRLFGEQAGYIDIPDPALTSGEDTIETGWYEFVVLSRSTLDGNFKPVPEPLEYDSSRASYRGHRGNYESQTVERTATIDEKRAFDTAIFDRTQPLCTWRMFDVLMVAGAPANVRQGVVAPLVYRRAIGRIPVDAFLACSPEMEVIELG